MEEWRDIQGYEGLYQVSSLGRVKSLERYTPVIRNGELFKRFQKERIRHFSSTTKGYSIIVLINNYKPTGYAVNRLVAITFNLPIPEHLENIPIEKLDVDHIDGDRKNNRVDNLRWTTHKENMENPITRQRMSESHKGMKWSKESIKKSVEKRCKTVLQLDKITNEIIKEWTSATEVQKQMGYSQSSISACCRGLKKFRTAYGFKWKYK